MNISTLKGAYLVDRIWWKTYSVIALDLWQIGPEAVNPSYLRSTNLNNEGIARCDTPNCRSVPSFYDKVFVIKYLPLLIWYLTLVLLVRKPTSFLIVS